MHNLFKKLHEDYKQRWRSNNTTQTCNRYETFSDTFTCFILSMCCTEKLRHTLRKDAKHVSPSAKRVPRHLRGYSTASKKYCVYVPSTREVISSYDVLFEESFSSALSYTSRPYSEPMAVRPAVTYTSYATSS